MDAWQLTNVISKYKKCPGCGSSWKDTKLKSRLENEIITIYCECGFEKKVDENNKEIVDKSSVEIRLYNHKTGKVLYENLNMHQLEHILKVLDPKGWV